MMYIQMNYVSEKDSPVAYRIVMNIGLINTDENKVSVKASTANTVWIISGITVLRSVYQMPIRSVLFKTRLDHTKQ